MNEENGRGTPQTELRIIGKAMATNRHNLFTIGHTTRSFEEFAGLLKKHGVTAVADVRSHPYSGRLEHFNRETLAARLESMGIRYVFLGQELGARRDEQECYEAGQASYQRIATLPKFQEGLKRLREGACRYQIALMCAEKEPLDCHRTILVCRHVRDEFNILHILADGCLEQHEHTEKRLVRRMNVSRTLFELELDDEELVQRAYDDRAKQIAYRRSEEGSPK